MLFATIAQPLLFLWMMLAGMAAALWYAAVELFRRLMQAGALLSLFTDCVFAIGLAAIITAFLLWGNYGQLRIYALLGAACGYALMHFAVIRPVSALLCLLGGRLRGISAKIRQNRLFNIIFK